MPPARTSCHGAAKMRESLTRSLCILSALIGIASKVAPLATLPLSCCSATSVSARSLEGGPPHASTSNWGPRTPSLCRYSCAAAGLTLPSENHPQPGVGGRPVAARLAELTPDLALSCSACPRLKKNINDNDVWTDWTAHCEYSFG